MLQRLRLRRSAPRRLGLLRRSRCRRLPAAASASQCPASRSAPRAIFSASAFITTGSMVFDSSVCTRASPSRHRPRGVRHRIRRRALLRRTQRFDHRLLRFRSAPHGSQPHQLHGRNRLRRRLKHRRREALHPARVRYAAPTATAAQTLWPRAASPAQAQAPEHCRSPPGWRAQPQPHSHRASRPYSARPQRPR